MAGTPCTVLVLGADGYLGWPMALRLSASGDRVVAIDNLARRRWDVEGGTAPLNPVKSMSKRLARWKRVSGLDIEWRRLDLRDADAVHGLFAEYRPDAVIHFAELRSAPYSMIDLAHATLAQTNNVVGTLNVLFAIRDLAPECHLIKLGTMGEYGCPNIDIEEGWIDIEHNGRRDRLPFPKSPHSFYHLSKVHDSHNIMFCCRVWGIRATDLNQGVVYGVETEETRRHSDLNTRFDYDSIWGTALNRFCVQAAVNMPLTVYGQGGQTRGMLDIRDTLACITLALDNPAERGEFRVFNQFTEQFSLNQLATMVSDARAARGLPTKVAHIPNPRVEAESHYYNARHQALLDLGLRPHLLGSTLLDSLVGWVERYADRVDPVLLQEPSVDWRTGGNDVWRRYSQSRRSRRKPVALSVVGRSQTMLKTAARL